MSGNETKAAAQKIAMALGETHPKPRKQIAQVIERCGIDFAEKVLQETLEVEANGGIMVDNGERKRTVGGVFFYLARKYMPMDVRDEIFHTWRVIQRQKAVFEAQFPPFEWDQRTPVIQKLLANAGEVSDVKVSLTGRPGAIERRQNLVVTTMQYQGSGTYTLPNGVPAPPQTPMTYVVYISSKQWERVEKAIQKEDDELVVDGLCAFDPETNGLAVFTTFVSTKKLQRKDRKQARREAENANGSKQQTSKPGSPRSEKQADGAKQGKKGEGKARAGEAAHGDISDKIRSEIVRSLPPGLPPQVAQKLTDLHTAAATFRQKITALEAKPASQQVGLEMTRKLLQNTEKQIEALEKQHVHKA